MSAFSVDSDALFAATATMRGTIDRLQAESGSLLAQLTQLQSSWTGSAAVLFHGTVEQWRATQLQVEDALAAIGQALTAAGQQYLEVEQANASLFR
ncbi:WXG100 family type VII secretion target [Microbacterium sp. SORGH_AS_0888]|uniref:WXG100 family type VII secretion target n=1 Tax=Microbacterium sp. SORGH_AS_0888 TaxID=3041791 RepID=UPI00277F881E|nr:WXG100 family type VII secretion target [Microbacterium sp. SORGH_AS_0888]MDQ1131095.1 early secretory antigenic target protein ESAT-6 [Microbacterium sp. SORGH_AS_0888]